MLVPPEFRRGLTIAIGFITLIEALCWALLTAYFVAVNACVLSFPFVTRGVTQWNMFFVSYFMGNCAQGNALKGDFGITAVPATATGMQPWFIIYAVVNSVWIPASVLLIAASVSRVRGTCAAFLYYPWLLVIIVTIILDVVATAVHIEDVFNTLNMADYGRFIGSTSFSDRNQSISPYLPALWITLFYIRFIILWIVNVVFFLVVYRVCKHIRNYKHRYQQTTPLTKNDIKRKSWLNAFYEGPDPSLVAERTKSERDDSRSEMSIRRGVVGIDNPIRTVEVHNVDSNSDSGGRQLKDKEESDVPSKPKWRLDEFGIPIEEIIPRPLSRQGSVDLREHPKNSPSPTQSQDHIFDYLGRPTRVPSLRKIGREQPPPSRGPEHLPPAELRSQIPWSYFKPVEQLPPKLQRHLYQRDVEDEEKPPVPVPDYTFHFNRRPRPVAEAYAETRLNLPVSRQRSFENHPSRYVPPKPKPSSVSGDYPLQPHPLSSSTRPVQQYPPQQDYAQSRHNPPPPRPPKPIMENIENSYPLASRQQKEYQPSNRNDVLPQEYIINPRQPSYYARQPSQEQNVRFSSVPVAV